MPDNTPLDSFIALWKSLNISANSPLSIGHLNSEVKNQWVITEYDGSPEEDIPVERPFIQVRYYNTSQRACKNDSWEAYEALKNITNVRSGDYRIMKIHIRQSPFELGSPLMLNNESLYLRVFNLWFECVR